jgi:hypothetical protein
MTGMIDAQRRGRVCGGQGRNEDSMIEDGGRGRALYGPVPLTRAQFDKLDTVQRRALARDVAADWQAGIGGRAIREKYDADYAYANDPTGGRSFLSGKRRRKLLREHGFDHLIAPSYLTYRDGSPRVGGGPSRQHGRGLR